MQYHTQLGNARVQVGAALIQQDNTAQDLPPTRANTRPALTRVWPNIAGHREFTRAPEIVLLTVLSKVLGARCAGELNF